MCIDLSTGYVVITQDLVSLFRHGNRTNYSLNLIKQHHILTEFTELIKQMRLSYLILTDGNKRDHFGTPVRSISLPDIGGKSS